MHIIQLKLTCNKMKKFIFFAITIFIFLTIFQNCFAMELLLDWPTIGDQSLGEQSSVPELIKYIYTFALGICGIAALISIVYGAAQYTFSAGDSSKAGDAKNRITQALLGIVTLLFAVLVLSLINPDLIKLGIKLPKITPPPIPENDYYCYGYCSSILENITSTNPYCGLNPDLFFCLGKIDTKNAIVAGSMCRASVQSACPAWKIFGGCSYSVTTPCSP